MGRSKLEIGALFLFLFYLLATNTEAGFVQQGGKLVRSGNAGVAGQGWSVALSTDGNTAIIGGPTDGTDCCAASRGAAWIFTQSGSSILRRESFRPQSILINGNSLQFDLPQNGKVMIRLFNAKGQVVANRLDEIRNAGVHSFAHRIERLL